MLVSFALTMVPIMAAVGAAVDYSRANSDRAAMQATADATALMLSKSAASLTSSQMNQQAADYFRALFTRPEVTNLVVNASYSNQGGSQVVVTASGTVPTTIATALGTSGLNVNVSSTVRWGNSRLRVALVLDNTGSMSQYNKMTALKKAAHNLLGQLKNAASQNGDVYVSIIPFANAVNVDPVNNAAWWVRWDLWNSVNGSCSKSKYTTQSDCIANKGTWNPNNHNTWDGCVTDRDQNYDVSNSSPVASSTPTQFPAWQTGIIYSGTWYDTCPVPVQGLTYDWTALNNKIDAMQPNGYTNQAIGLAWGWQSLTSSPFSIPAMDSNYTYQQVIILLTDGLNTQDRWYSDQGSIDAREQTLCNSIKAAGITLYTVQVNTDGDPTSTLLQNCASDPSKFFLLTSSTQIVATFDQIGTTLSRLRVSN